MEYAAIAILSAVAIFLIARPMLSRKRYLYHLEDIFDMRDARQLNYLNSLKMSVLENLKELEFEYEMGKLSDEDYKRLRNDYLREAEDVVQAIDKLKIREEIEELIEREARARRRIQ